MKQKQETATFAEVIKHIRDDIEDGKLDKTLKELEKKHPAIFLKVAILREIKDLPSIQELPK